MVFHIRLFFFHDYCYEFHRSESYFESYLRFVKGPAGDCEDDIHDDINILWTPYLYFDVCLHARLEVGWLEY